MVLITKYLSATSMNSCHCVWLMRHYLKCLFLFFFFNDLIALKIVLYKICCKDL